MLEVYLGKRGALPSYSDEEDAAPASRKAGWRRGQAQNQTKEQRDQRSEAQHGQASVEAEPHLPPGLGSAAVRFARCLLQHHCGLPAATHVNHAGC